MQSPFSLGKVAAFMLLNILISAITTWVVVRVLVPPLPALPAQAAAAATAMATQPAAANPPTELQPTAPTTPTETPSQPAAGPASQNAAQPGPAASNVKVKIASVVYAGQQSREGVVITNEGEQINLNGWKIVAPTGDTYQFGNITLFKDGIINVYSTRGNDSATNLFWNLDKAVWNTGDEVKLVRGDETVATFIVK
jgi:hypothetical protein